MRFENPPHLAGVTHVPGDRAETVAEALAGGRMPGHLAAQISYYQLLVSDVAPPDMAVEAARRSLAAAGVPATDLDLLLHAHIYHQGHEFWSVSHYIAARLGATRAVPVAIQQMCNGGATAIDLAARHLLADPAARLALVTTADRFAEPGFDRWAGDSGVAYGDGATALLVSREPHGPGARLLASAAAAASELEGMHRGDLAFAAAPTSGTETLRPWLTKKQFRDRQPAADFGKTAAAAVTAVIAQVLADAGVASDDPRLQAVTLPRLSAAVVGGVYAEAAREACAAPVLTPGRDTGHLGAGDTAANLADLLADGSLLPGDLVVLVGAGAGFTWSALLVEVTG